MTTKLHQQVRQFHLERDRVLTAQGRPDLVSHTPETPGVPKESVLRLRLGLVAEEALELFAAVCGEDENLMNHVEGARYNLRMITKRFKPSDIDLIELADALGDLDYVVEGLRQSCGIDGEPIAEEISRTNLAKLGEGARVCEDGKVLKPEGWESPRIQWELHKQGWKGDEE